MDVKKTDISNFRFGLGLALVGLIWSLVWLPSFTSLGMAEAEVVGTEDCSCKSQRGVLDVYSFKFEDKTYNGTAKNCICSRIPEDEIGKGGTLLFDSDKPDNNLPLSDLIIPFGIFSFWLCDYDCLWCGKSYGKEQAMIKKQLKK